MAQKQRILHRRHKLYGDGVTKMQMIWAESLKEHVIFDFWLSEENREFTDWFRNNGSRIYIDETIQNKKKFNKLHRILYFIRFLQKHEYDCIHLNTDALGIWSILFVATIAGVKKRIVHSHNSFSAGGVSREYLNPLVQTLAREMIWLFSTEHLACSREAALWLFPKRKVDQVEIIHNGIYVKNFFFNENKREKYRNEFCLCDKFVIGFTGRLSNQKNLFYLLDIFSEYHKTDPDSVLVITGEGELETELRQYALSLGVTNAMVFTGYSNDIQGILSSLDCFVMPSLFEGLCISLVEAQCNGLPCIVSDTNSRYAQFTDLVTFVPIEKVNVMDWVSAISEAKQRIIDRNSYNKLAINGPYNIDNCSKEILDVYNRL